MMLLLAGVGAWYTTQQQIAAMNIKLDTAQAQVDRLERTAVSQREVGEIAVELRNINTRISRIEAILERMHREMSD